MTSKTHPESAGIRSLAVGFPREVRTNAWFRERHPEVYERFEQKTLARVFQNQESSAGSRLFDRAMEPYLHDPFRGTVERRILGPGESQLGLELDVARRALAAAQLEPREVDLILVAAFPTEHIGVGDGAFLAGALGVTCPAWNIETTCSATLASLQTACAMVTSGQYRNVLVVVACLYSRAADWSDTLTWFFGDGASAFVVSAAPPGEGLLAVHSVNTSDTCGAFRYSVEKDAAGDPRVVIRAGLNPSRALRDTSAPVVQTCCREAVSKAGFTLGDVDFFVCNTPLAWYAEFFADALEIPREKTISTYERLANIGPALTAANLYEAASTGKIRPGALVLLYTVGTVSSAGAALLRWGDVALAPPTG